MAMIFFQVGLTDLTPAVDVQHYDVNVNDVYTAWTDANWIEHRDKVRTRIEGRIILGYSNAASFAAAVTTIATALILGIVTNAVLNLVENGRKKKNAQDAKNEGEQA